MQVEVKEENVKKENNWLKALKRKIQYLLEFFGEESVIIRILVAKRFNLPINSLFLATRLKLRYSEFGISIPTVFNSYEAFEVMEKIDSQSSKIRQNISEFLYMTRNIRPQKPSQILASLIAEYTRYNPLFDLINDYYTKVYVLAYIITICKILGLDQKTILESFIGSISEERWKVWQAIIYIMISNGSQREEVMNRRQEKEIFLQRIFSEKPDIYASEFLFIDTFFNKQSGGNNEE